ncbi:hypothetical protein [Parasitella parasitica]|uniref:Uncharacterized protein n=1 Tax=Parasitella parasitica TaxID=35722 RepID=A0A0B7NIE4_9FUNG|nr:hypothetical protein [Parasitella parasitica]
MIPFQLFYDITSVKIKYEEGFANILGRIITKPEQMWTKADKALVIPTEYSLVTGFSLQTGTLVLLQCFWNFLANSVAKRDFMSSKEFMFYIGWTFVSFIIFPILQYNFSRDVYEPTFKEIIPQMVYGIELFTVGCLGVVSHFRFKKLLRNAPDNANGRAIIQKVQYFQEINVILTTVLFGHGGLLTALSADGLTTRKFLNLHKFTADFFIFNMCAVVTWLCMILIFHPKQTNAVEAAPEEEDDMMMTKQSANITFISGLSNDNAYPHSPTLVFGAAGNNYPHAPNLSYGDSQTSGNAPTLVFGNSQASNDYNYKAPNPLNKSPTTNTNTPSAFQFGPLPIIPPAMQTAKHDFVTSTPPSMNTLVSHQQYNQGKPTGAYPRSGSISASSDTFQVTIPDEKMIPSTEEYYDPRASHNAAIAAAAAASKYQQQQQQQLEELGLSQVTSKHNNTLGKQELEEDEYVPPPLSPAKKSRGDATQNMRVEQDRRSYTQSMMTTPCEEDMREFGVKKSNEEITVQKEEVTNTFQNFQQQHTSNNSMLTSFKELGFDSLTQNAAAATSAAAPSNTLNHSSSSLMLPLPFETSNYSLSSYNDAKDDKKSSSK